MWNYDFGYLDIDKKCDSKQHFFTINAALFALMMQNFLKK